MSVVLLVTGSLCTLHVNYNIISNTLVFSYFCKILNKAEIIKGNAVQQCKDEVNIQVSIHSFVIFLVKIVHLFIDDRQE